MKQNSIKQQPFSPSGVLFGGTTQYLGRNQNATAIVLRARLGVNSMQPASRVVQFR
jgi:hypothetical protein